MTWRRRGPALAGTVLVLVLAACSAGSGLGGSGGSGPTTASMPSPSQPSSVAPTAPTAVATSAAATSPARPARTTSAAPPRSSAHHPVPPTSAPPPISATGTIAQRAAAAVRYANQRGMTSGVAVLDTRTNSLFAAGNSGGYYASASVVKTLIATRLLLAGQMSGSVATLAKKMIEQSDNDAAWTLYPKVGKDGLLPWVEHHYGIQIGAPPTMPGIWGSTQLSARGLVRFYAAVHADTKVWPWLSTAMHAYAARSSSGEPNAFGIAVAAPASAVKNGWDTNRDVKAPHNAIINTTGFVEGDRYAVAILSEGAGSLYYSRGEQIVTDQALMLIAHRRLS